MYSQLDKTTDKNGRYLLNDNVATATGRSLFGANLVIVADEVLGGGAKAFVGSLKAFVLETVRSNLSVKLVENAYFETVLGVALRADFKQQIQKLVNSSHLVPQQLQLNS